MPSTLRTLALLVLSLVAAARAEPAAEFRGAWVATVFNLDWPSKPGLSAERQQAELRAILDRAKAIKLNAILLQIRPAGDALYASKIEPWSACLTGTQGEGPGYVVGTLPVRLTLQNWIAPWST